MTEHDARDEYEGMAAVAYLVVLLLALGGAVAVALLLAAVEAA